MKKSTNKKMKLENFFSKKRGMVCTTQLPWGCTPLPPFKKRSSSEKRENYALSNEQLRKYTIYMYTCVRARARPLGAKN